ncbi:chromosome segregation protein SMC [Tissierella sp. Yu-01]|uniref:chromosome segregation protein SMC n=1 Tax=Tissierella sp. Yu-01 TaxID=3035694 RepID=UPI00240D3747|nr:chromosome segregation protein SMC [Tissierella sp. Yu-01]WFA09788.1 chromosome segregation protein SMC [Tissierella sp. Yu-01]
MYLKKLEIQGFKSFADKTEIEFKNEITAIVGPNGSGKSNISDAIRWVLGEQSIKSLRGTRMEDVIFSGTDKRRALGYAEVTITFDNSDGKIPVDYIEVAVTRRMFRSGESEYYINKNSCRLKDIRELFMDSGIGKDGYSIIGQGRIEEILSNKPEDRRNIFEEAAGIIKYKTKKEEAERKLDKTDNNLTRIKDLIHEVSSQKESLEIEADKAIKFTKFFTKLRDLEVNLYIRNIRKLENQIKDVKLEKEKLVNDLKLIDEERLLIETEYNNHKSNIQKIENEIEEKRTIKFDTIQSYEKNKNQVSILLEKENFLRKDFERLQGEKEDFKFKFHELENSEIETNRELEDINKQLNDINFEFNNKTQELKELDNSIHINELELENSKNIMLSYYNLTSDKKSEINSIIAFKNNIDSRVIQLNKDIEFCNIRKEELIKELDVLYSNETVLKEKTIVQKEKINSLYIKKADIENEYKVLENVIRENQIKLNGLNTSLNIIKNMEADYEGYYKSVKGLLKGTSNDIELRKGLVGVVADLFKVDYKYERAIDICLGSNIQNIVVETESDAKKFVKYLKEKHLGRATFLPLNIIKGKTIRLDQRDMDEFNIIGLAHELLTYDEKYKNIFEFLIGRTIVVKGIDDGIKLSKKLKHMYKIVTLDGEVFNTGGSITGGSTGNGKESISIINRKNKIKSLKEETSLVNNEISKYEEKKLIITNNLRDIENETVALENNTKTLEISILENINKQSSIKYEINRTDEEIKKKEAEIANLNKEHENFQANREELDDALREIEIKTEDLKNIIKEKNEVFTSLKDKRNELDKEITNLRITINTIENQKEALLNKTQNYYLTNEQYKNSLIEKEKAIDNINTELIALKDDREKIQSEVIKYESSEDTINIILNDLIKKKDALLKKFYDEQDRLKVLNKRISDIENQGNSHEVKLTRFEIQYENYHTKLMDDYEMTLEDALKLEREISDFHNVQIEIRELKDNIKELGNVNISAIDEFKNISERFEFLTIQQNDLIKAKEDLKEVIRDMEKKMRVQFISSFDEINNNFTEVFAILFNGGTARLELEDEEDILTSGIEIKVQPPGKKLQSLSLLSGGEKSLTAVALLFSILRMKPSPFCILDEIDAALDEANIYRYTKYLKSFDDMTQFVLITHRKTTMEIADVLYGVTMEEEGVSKLISVKLKDNLVEAS